MASTIAAVTTSGGGVVTTADASGNLNLLAGATTVVALTNAGAAVTGTLSATGTTKIGTTGTNGVLDLARTYDGATISTFKTDGTNGIINSVAATIIQVNTAEKMRIDSSGNVGIGTSVNNVYDGVAQPRPLVVQSSSTTTTQYDSTNAIVICNSDTTTNNASQLNFAAITGASTNQYTSAAISCIYGARTNTVYPSGILTFATSVATQAPVERMRIDSSGNVGIGTTTLTNKFNVAGAIQSSSTLVAVATNTVALSQESGYSRLAAFGPNNSTGGVLYLYSISANGSVQNGAVIDASGNVGIGTTSPSYKLDVNGTLGVSGATVYAGSAVMTIGDATRTASSSTTTGAIVCGGGLGVWSTVNAGGSGNFADTVSVFTQNPSNTAQGVLFRNLYNTGAHLFSQGAATTNTYISWINGNGTVGSIAATGSGVAYNTSSDYRLKNTVAPMTGALAKVALLKPVTYKWNVDGSDGQGFIAHELAEVEPNCVTGEKDATREEEYEITPAVPAVLDADGKETTPAVQAVKGTRTVPSYQGVDTSFLVATLTAAIQELKAIIDTQATRIAALENK